MLPELYFEQFEAVFANPGCLSPFHPGSRIPDSDPKTIKEEGGEIIAKN
jgi:hypothetical protein